MKFFKQGYRHIKLRNNQNQPLEISSIFVYSRKKLENIDKINRLQTNLISNFTLFQSSNEINSSSLLSASSKSKQKLFKFLIYGLNGVNDDDSGIQVKVNQDTTVFQVIEQALAKIDKNAAERFKEKQNFVLIQECDRKWSSHSANIESESSRSINYFKKKQLNSYRHLRTKSLCVFYNNSGLLASNKINEKKNISNNLCVFDSKNSFNQIKSDKETKILEYGEKILDSFKNYNGSVKFVIRDKSSSLVSIFLFYFS